jgi:hypothetical protein
MRLGIAIVLLVSSTLTGCASDPGAISGEQLPRLLPGKILWAVALHPELCKRDACQATYRVRIKNPMDRDANVQECSIVDPPRRSVTTLPIMRIAGLLVPAAKSLSWQSSFQLPISPRAVRSLSGLKLRCTGVDWRGTPPI